MLMTKGNLFNEFGEKVGSFWYRTGMNAYTLRLYRVNRNGYTLEGIQRKANDLDLYIEYTE